MGSQTTTSPMLPARLLLLTRMERSTRKCPRGYRSMDTILPDRQRTCVTQGTQRPRARSGAVWRVVLVILALGAISAIAITMKLAVINNSKERLICMGQLTEIEMALFSY